MKEQGMWQSVWKASVDEAMVNFGGDLASSVAAISSQLLAFMLEEIDYGMLLVDDQLRVLHMNNAARRRFDGGHTIEVSNGRMTAQSAQDMHTVRDAVLAATGRMRRGLLELHRQGRREVYAVVPLQLSEHQTLALLLASRDDVCQALSWQAFARLHGLTPAEAAVLEGLCKGERPNELADRFGVAISTIRTQIASVRAKAGAQTVGELIRELATLPPLLSALRQ
jgi:DNA-binding CsgD family transcriptional regulator